MRSDFTMNMSTKKLIETCDFISIDTSALMETDTLLDFLKRYEDIFIEANRVLFVYREVIAELRELSNSVNSWKSCQANKALKIIKRYYTLFRLEKEGENNFDTQIIHKRIADQRFISVVNWYKREHAQLFITNDKDLLEGITEAGQMKAVQGKPVYAARLSDNGELVEYHVEKRADGNENNQNSTDENASYIDGQLSGVIIGSIFSAVVVGGISYLLHIQSKMKNINLDSKHIFR